jgi:hypothetical protein
MVVGMLCGVMCAVLTQGVAAPARPNLSGVWTLTAPNLEPKAAAGGVAALPPSDLTIEHSAAAIAIARTAFDQVTMQRFALDGTESTNRSGAVTRVTRSRWDGAKLVTEGRMSQVTSQGYAAWTVREILSLDARGRLIIDSEWVSSDGVRTASTKEYTKKKS